MRKAGLLDKKPLTATQKMLTAAEKDAGIIKKAVLYYGNNYQYTEYESRFYFRAEMSAIQDILEVDLFTRKDLAAGMKEPRFRIFLDREKKDFISWNVMEEKWSSAKIDMLDTGDDRYRYSYRGKNYAAIKTLNLVNRYLKTGCMQDVEAAVLDFQAGIRKCALNKKHRLITDVIDGYMDTVPDRVPADWMKFINDRALEHSIFYTKETQTGYCTHCRQHVHVSTDVKHNMAGKCSQCGISIKYRSWKMQKHTYFRTIASLLQRCTDGCHYVYRQFRVDMYAEKSRFYEPEITVIETYRNIFSIAESYHYPMIRNPRGYEWGNFRQTGIVRWCEEGTSGNYDYGYAGSVLYTGNIRKLFNAACLKYIPIAEIFKSLEKKKINVLEVLSDMSFPYEAYWKMGLKRFVQERIERDGRDGLTKFERYEQHMKPWVYLKITKDDMKQAVRLNASDQQMRIIQLAAARRVKLTDEQAAWFDRHVCAHVILNYLDRQTPRRIIRYLREQTGAEQYDAKDNIRLHLWTDYLDMAQQLGWDLQDRSVFFPQDLERAHDETATLYTIWKDRAESEKMKEKDALMSRHAKEIKKAFCYRNDQYIISVPGCFLDFKKEGTAQHNCVATYYERALRGECIILFIRRRKAPKESFCTVEIRNNAGKFEIRQNRTMYNKDAPEDAKEFLEKAVKEAQKIADRMAAEAEKELRRKTAG